MIDALLQLARREIIALTPYSSARREVAMEGIYLNANENPYPKKNQQTIHRYPQPQPTQLRSRLSELYGIDEDHILMTRGSDEGIDLWLRAFCNAGVDSIMICPPTYDMYALSAMIQHASVISVPLIADTFALNKEKMLSDWNAHCKLIFLCSPNNPTGNTYSKNDILFICEKLKDKAIVIVDEAYIEFAAQDSMTSEIATHPNLVVLRTLSKAYGMAGARCGAVLAHPKLIQLLEKIISPYPLARPIVDVVLQELEPEHLKQVYVQIDAIKSARKDLSAFLNQLPYVEKVWPSEANFILLKVKNAQDLIAHCAKSHIIIRDRSKMLGLDNCVRISIGTENENQRLKSVLESYE